MHTRSILRAIVHLILSHWWERMKWTSVRSILRVRVCKMFTNISFMVNVCGLYWRFFEYLRCLVTSLRKRVLLITVLSDVFVDGCDVCWFVVITKVLTDVCSICCFVVVLGRIVVFTFVIFVGVVAWFMLVSSICRHFYGVSLIFVQHNLC